MSTFGRYLRSVRVAAGLSQRVLATACGIDISYVSKLENDRLPHTPSARTLSLLAAALKVDEMELFDAAGKLVGPLATISGQPQALKVMRAAAHRIDSPRGWELLRQYVESEDFAEQLAASPRAQVPA